MLNMRIDKGRGLLYPLRPDNKGRTGHPGQSSIVSSSRDDLGQPEIEYPLPEYPGTVRQ